VSGGADNDTVYGGNNNCADLAGGGQGSDGNDGVIAVILPGALTHPTSVTGGTGDDEIYGGNNNACAGAINNTDGNDIIFDRTGADVVYGGNNNNGTLDGNTDGTDAIDTNEPTSAVGNYDTAYGGNNGTPNGVPLGDATNDTFNADGTGDVTNQNNNP
jgi:hypothetical protein